MAMFYRLVESQGWLFRVYSLYLRTLHVVRSIGCSDQHEQIWDEIVSERFPVGSNLYYTFRTYRFTSRTYRIPILPGKLFYLFIVKRTGLPFWDNCDLRLGPLLDVGIRWKGQYDRRFIHVIFFPRKRRTPWSVFGSYEIRGPFEVIHELIELERGLSVSCWWWGPGSLLSLRKHDYPNRLYCKLGKLFGLGKGFTPEERLHALELHDSTLPDFRRNQVRDALTGRRRNLIKELFPDICIDCGEDYAHAHHTSIYHDPSRCDDCYAKHIGNWFEDNVA